MKLTKESNLLMSFFVENNCLTPIKQTMQTDKIMLKIYKQICDGFEYVKNTFDINCQIVNETPKPKTFPPGAFPDIVSKHIDDNSLGTLVYNFELFKRKITIYFILENRNITNKMVNKYNNYVENMLVWLYIINIYSSKDCVDNLKIFVYHTSLLKMVPKSNTFVLNENNVNTAFTRTCPVDSEIVIFRKEEWFKVFIHETFHNFGLDFSEFDSMICKEKILKIFPVNSELNLYEAYAEFWARIMNICFVSYNNMKTEDEEDYLANVELFINFERIFAFFQMTKVLNFMGLSYKHLYGKTTLSDNLRKTLYKEETSVLSYYIITAILMNNYQDFLLWCETNNSSLLQFKKTKKNIEMFCNFIIDKYKTKNMLSSVSCSEKMLKQNRGSGLNYLQKTLRMTICELG
jgi:hypothetical protein